MQRSDSYVRLSGELDTNSVAPALKLVSDAIEAATGPTVMIDLAGVTFADSSALAMLLDAKKQAEAAGHELRLLDVPQQLQRVLEITRLDDVFQTQETVGEASESA